MTTDTTESQPQAAPQPPPQPPRAGRLERSRDDRVIAGVCGGAARHLGIDPVLVRIAVLATVVFGGFGVVAYLAAWLMVPEEGAAGPLLGGARPRRTAQVAIVLGAALCAIGALSVWGDGWPFALVLFGAALVWFARERDRAGAVADGDGGAERPGGGDGGGADGPAGGAAEPAPERERGSWAVTALAAGAVCVVVAVCGALDAAGAVALGWGGVAAIAIVATGVALVASSFFGGARALIPLGIVLALLLGGTAAAGVSFNGGVGERAYRVLDGDELRARYELGVGHLLLDLRGLEPARGTTRVEADLDVGMLEVVGDDVRIVDGGRAGARATGGFDVARTIAVGRGARRVEVEAHVGIGAISVGERPGRGEHGEWEWSSRGGRLPRAVPFAGALR